ncbi:substrate-binding domain-containing protein [Limnohabitans sp. 2KL-3]|uniref:substrate-binding domain-containing protein n=1 Tax=Limnohabitans sp. 2KL-3 TaxID=1100700 RepID=UPI001E386180|nr:substrate-binding domain-containing protein [Limnohabitans sp. 2KL-3]
MVARTYKPLLKTGLHDLTRAGVRFVNRSPGTGTRLLLDQWLRQASIDSGSLLGYGLEEPSHAAVAASMGSGQTDAGLGMESAAAVQGLDFVPLAAEDYWLVCLKSAVNSPAVQLLMDTLQSSGWATQMNALAGYMISSASGQIQSLKQRLPWWAHSTHKPST